MSSSQPTVQFDRTYTPTIRHRTRAYAAIPARSPHTSCRAAPGPHRPRPDLPSTATAFMSPLTLGPISGVSPSTWGLRTQNLLAQPTTSGTNPAAVGRCGPPRPTRPANRPRSARCADAGPTHRASPRGCDADPTGCGLPLATKGSIPHGGTPAHQAHRERYREEQGQRPQEPDVPGVVGSRRGVTHNAGGYPFARFGVRRRGQKPRSLSGVMLIRTE